MIHQVQKEVDQFGGQIDDLIPSEHTIGTAIENEGAKPE